MGYSIKRLLLVATFFAALVSGCSFNYRDSFAAQNTQAPTSKGVGQDQNFVAVAAIVTAPKANLRDKASLSAKVVKTVDRGDLLMLLSPNPVGPWYRIRANKTDSEAWINGNAIALLYTIEQGSSQTELQTAPRPRAVSSPTTGRSYVNVDGMRVPSPVFSDKKPEGATARCRDGSYSFSQHRQGTCSHHGGVSEWF